MDGKTTTPKITVPEQRLTNLSFCEANTKQLGSWVSELPIANIGETARRLYHAIIEINQLVIAPTNRYQLMEIIRKPIYFVCDGLSKHFLNQSIALHERQRKIANLTQALQLHLANGYKLVIHNHIANSRSSKSFRQLTPACHRAVTDLSRCIVHSSQLYCQSPPNVWLEIHQLFLFAHQHSIDKIRVKDDQLNYVEESTTEEAYKRILLLGCCKSNQMRQNDIALVFNAFENWARLTDVIVDQSSAGLFAINPEKDYPPHYRALLNKKVNKEGIGFDTANLVNQLTDYSTYLEQHKRAPEGVLEMPVRINENVLAALCQALGILSKRAFKRIAESGRVFLAVGLSSSHYFVGNGIDFSKQLTSNDNDDDNSNTSDYYLNKSKRDDIWSSSFDSSPAESSAEMSPINFTGASAKTAGAKVHYLQHIVPLINTSPGGYCMDWHGNVPGNLQAGELVSVREEESQPWSIAVIRWIRIMKQSGTQLGIELIAPRAKPCGVQLIQTTGESSEFLRGLLLPELPSIGQPTTLITPRLLFRAGHKVVLNIRGRETKVKLIRQERATGSFSQFEVKFLNAAILQTDDELGPGGASEDEFDSLWPKL